MEKREERIVVLAAVRYELKNAILRIEDEIKALAKVNVLTQVKYQSLNTRAYYGISHTNKDKAKDAIYRAIEEAIAILQK